MKNKNFEDQPLTPRLVSQIMGSPSNVEYTSRMVVDKITNLTEAVKTYIESDYDPLRKPRSFYLEHLIEYLKILEERGDFYNQTRGIRKSLSLAGGSQS